MGAYWIIRGREELDERLEFLKKHLLEKDVWPLRLDIKKFQNRRSLDQNALFWVWCEAMAEFFTEGGQPMKKQHVHDLLCHKFLGYVDHLIQGEKITKLRGTSGLDKGEFQHFMEQVDAWAVDLGIQLVYPAASEYSEYREAQVS